MQNKYHIAIKIKLTDVKSELRNTKTFFGKCYTQKCTEKVFMIKKVKNAPMDICNRKI